MWQAISATARSSSKTPASAATPEAHEATINSLGLLAEITTVDEVRTALPEAVTGTPA